MVCDTPDILTRTRHGWPVHPSVTPSMCDILDGHFCVFLHGR